MRVVVTRPAAEAQAWCLTLRQAGFDALALPLIAIAPLAPAERTPVDQAWRALAGYRAVMFVSAAAVQHFFDAAPPGQPWPEHTRAWAPGPGTAAVLSCQGVADDAIDTPGAGAAQLDSEALWDAAGTRIAPGDRVLIVRGAQQEQDDPAGAGPGRGWMADRLAAAGAQVTLVAAYRRGAPRWSAAETAHAGALAGPHAAWVFSNSEAIGHLFALLSDFAPTLRLGAAVATHPRIAATARAAGFARVELARAGTDGVTRALRRLGPSIESTG